MAPCLGHTATLLLADLIALELAGYWSKILLNSNVMRVGGSALDGLTPGGCEDELFVLCIDFSICSHLCAC